MIQAILFDFGNVLAGFDHRRATARFAPLAGLSEEEMYSVLYDGPLEHAFESGQLTADQFVAQAIDRIRYRGTPEQFRADFADIFTPNPEVLKLIPRLAEKYRLVLASNTNPLHTSQFRQQFADTLGYFHAQCVSWEAGARKPNVAFYLRCLTLAGCAADEAVFVDDVTANITGAAAVGIRGVQYQAGLDLGVALEK